MTYTAAELNQTGIYAIINKVNGKRYIGSAARRFRERWNLHKRQLKNNKHHSRILQRAWDKYGEENFEFRILEIIPKEQWIDNKYLTNIEQIYIDTHQPEYNICPIAGSLLGFKHSDETRMKMSLIQKSLVGKKKKRQYNPPSPEEQAFRTAKANKTLAKKNGWRNYNITDPNGNKYRVCTLTKFCQQYNLNLKGMQKVLAGSSISWNGWKVRYCQ